MRKCTYIESEKNVHKKMKTFRGRNQRCHLAASFERADAYFIE